ncbi:signal peptidase I [Aneurinibacillus migulanus]|uniref:signal peptidase I n=1 Tax=Aneurinibacillus migulanus TaxID=47500 RepID=UPI002E22A371|nr:signal peptidase I [Aneurinibacillus migulanus]MED4727581.1 signal peptidase I [Aneurinibacillus migulanus]
MKKFGALLMVYVLLLAISACSFSKDEEVMMDWHTSPKPQAIMPGNIAGKTIIRQYAYNDMENWRPYANQKCRVFYRRDIVLDLNYGDKDMSRGDIVYHVVPGSVLGYSLSRIVAFGDERVRIKEGQLYINGKVLDTFYGKFQHKGMSLKQYVDVHKRRERDKNEAHIMKMKKQCKVNMREIIVPQGHVFVVDDDWVNAYDSKQFGALPTEYIKGKVIGYIADKEQKRHKNIPL